MDDTPSMGTLGTSLRKPRIQGCHSRLSRSRAGSEWGRSTASRSFPIGEPRCSRGIRPLDQCDFEPRCSANPYGAFVRRNLRPIASRRRLGLSRRLHRWSGGERSLGSAFQRNQSDVSRTAQSGESAPRSSDHGGRVPLRIHQ